METSQKLAEDQNQEEMKKKASQSGAGGLGQGAATTSALSRYSKNMPARPPGLSPTKSNARTKAAAKSFASAKPLIDSGMELGQQKPDQSADGVIL